MTFYEWMDRIEARPGMYLDRAEFDTLKVFILGYQMALAGNRVNEFDTPPFAGFNRFVLQKLGRLGERAVLKAGDAEVDLGSIGWETAIADSADDGQEALELFFRLLREYRVA
jgi:hypothetical protein